MAFSGEHDDYFLVIYDDQQGNIDIEGKIDGGIVRYLKDNGFKCRGDYWSMRGIGLILEINSSCLVGPFIT